RDPPEIFAVTTVVEVAATPRQVWPNVIEFGEIAAPPDFVFRAGVAHPLRARIEGEGVGAVRYCEFSTGPFVEPVTVWDAPRRLGFDVAEQPAALREWSPYRTVYAPHVKGFFRSARGEFRLVELPGGRTRLEGSTWYTLDVHPHAYWRPIAEWLLTSIHTRVLQQVKRETEAAHSAAGGSGSAADADRASSAGSGR
ncbi:MAG TPA: SRPBCC family protein, partial [Longimicrobium sp.]|nr:SRPBCC family protein [Longimicrobium sp.]